MDTLLNIEDLCVSFNTDDGTVPAVDHVSLRIERGETLGLVGESGCGKSVTALSALRLIPSPPGHILSGRVAFGGGDILRMPFKLLREVRGRQIGMIFQEPTAALSPLHRIGRQLVEALKIHRDMSTPSARRLALEWLTKVGIPDAPQRLHAYPHELSGGMQQRVMIAMALMLEPSLLIADEPTTALDVTIQAQVLDLMRALKERDASILLITHDMGVIWEMCTRVAVMYAAEIVESGPVRDIFDNPLHPYTEALIRTIPALSGERGTLAVIKGQVPSGLSFPTGCRFRERCAYAFERCAIEHPEPARLGARSARCFLAQKRMENSPAARHTGPRCSAEKPHPK